MTFDVKFSHEAKANVREIRDWIAKRSQDGALRWLDSLEQARTKLSTSANSFALAPEAEAFDEELRQILFNTRRGNTYRALFVIRGTTVHVVSVRGTGQELVRSDEINLPE